MIDNKAANFIRSGKLFIDVEGAVDNKELM